MGVALKDNGLSEAAIDCYQRILKITPNYAEAYHNMSIALSEKGDFENGEL
jgi:tetratricopeptide (TPR) repeat protein